MTTPSEEEARAEANSRFRGQRMHVGTVTDREVQAFLDGVAWAASRVSTPPSEDALFAILDQHTPIPNSDYCRCGATWGPAHLVAALVGDTTEFGVFVPAVPALPTDREALFKVIALHRECTDGGCAEDQGIADAVIASGFRRSVVSTPDFCDECAGPYGGWLRHYNGHWDTCPNRAVGAGGIAPFAARLRQSADRLVSEPEAHRLMYEAAEMAETLEYSAVSAPPTITDEALARVLHADDVDKGRAFATFEAMDPETQAWYFDNARAVIAHLSTRAALGGEGKTGE